MPKMRRGVILAEFGIKNVLGAVGVGKFGGEGGPTAER